jgi:hypothetical protein
MRAGRNLFLPAPLEEGEERFNSSSAWLSGKATAVPINCRVLGSVLIEG